MLYFSSGSVRGGLNPGACPGALPTKNRENRQMKTPVFKILRWIMIRNSLSERWRMTRRRTSVKGENAEVTQAKRTGFQDLVLLGFTRRKRKGLFYEMKTSALELRDRIASVGLDRLQVRPI